MNVITHRKDREKNKMVKKWSKEKWVLIDSRWIKNDYNVENVYFRFFENNDLNFLAVVPVESQELEHQPDLQLCEPG